MSKNIKIVNRAMIAVGLLTLATGIYLHVGYHQLKTEPTAHAWWTWSHIVCAVALIVLATIHVVKNGWWLRTLRLRLQRVRSWLQRVFTPLVVLAFLALIATGVCLFFGWYSTGSHIWMWHYVLGLVWAGLALLHGLAFYRPATRKAAVKAGATAVKAASTATSK